MSTLDTNEEKQDLSQYPDELSKLQETEALIGKELAAAEEKIAHFRQEFEEMQQEKKEHYYEMDGREHIQMNKALHELDSNAAEIGKTRVRYQKLMDSPYFARFDFAEDGGKKEQYYIGRFGFNLDYNPLIYDWRAPVSSMFYDCETGQASYVAPMGKIEGEMTLKRQFRIKNGELEYVLDTSQAVSDEILQQELSKNSNEKMKTIVTTIQREQNSIIREKGSSTMIIQGVAGSGKTSIALHRIAFLLYRYKNNIKADEVMILSPSKVFADYISGVIPELGEEPVRESGFYDLAVDLLDNVIDFEDEISALDVTDEGWKKRAAFKSTPEFLDKLLQYAENMPERIFNPKDYTFEGKTIEKEWIRDTFLFYKNEPIMERMQDLTDDLLDELQARLGLRYDLPKRTAVLNRLKNMLIIKSPGALYRDFYRANDLGSMLNMHGNRLEWPDVYPFLLLWDRYRGLGRHMYVKHVVVDEMQDYTPVQYEVLNRMYPCTKTILGDFGQAMDPCHAYTIDDLRARFPEARYVEMNKSFRSTYEIMTFALQIQPQQKLEPIDRHGDAPKYLLFDSEAEEEAAVLEATRKYAESGQNALGILLHTNREAAAFYEHFSKVCPEAVLLAPDSKEYKGGILVTSIQMAKGLEFDEVIVPQADAAHYSGADSQKLLYVACTRAMHRLTLTGVGEASPYLPEK